MFPPPACWWINPSVSFMFCQCRNIILQFWYNRCYHSYRMLTSLGEAIVVIRGTVTSLASCVTLTTIVAATSTNNSLFIITTSQLCTFHLTMIRSRFGDCRVYNKKCTLSTQDKKKPRERLRLLQPLSSTCSSVLLQPLSALSNTAARS